MDKKQNLQDTFLNAVRKSKTPQTIFLYQRVIEHLAVVEPRTSSSDPLEQIHDRWKSVMALLAVCSAAVPDEDIYAREARRHLETVAASVRHAITRNRSAVGQTVQQKLVL